jgi:hypothetical protein
MASSEGGVTRFAEAVPCDEMCRFGHANTHRPKHCDGMRHDCGLRIFGKLQLVVGPFAHQPEEMLVQRFVDFVEHVPCGAAGLGERCAHAGCLTALPRENECAHLSPCYEPPARLGRCAEIAKAGEHQ